MNRIHIFGASGSGTTTLGKQLSQKLNARHFDSNDYYWKKTNPPFIEKNPIPERHRLLLEDMGGLEGLVLSGSMHSWSDPFLPLFDLVVFLYVPAEVRIERLRRRERERYGSRILPGGDMHQAHLEFIEWARQYDQGEMSGRSKKLHEEWMARLSCPILRIENEIAIESAVKLVLERTK
ncbi:MAG: AAA family ATPase [Bdellovibrionaceae bacterium]|nr:AAA family ATPase [Pseudobdellovibrionaceae bacterium]